MVTMCVLTGIFSQSGTEGGGVSLVCGKEGKVVWSKGDDGGISTILTAEGGVITKLRADPGNRYRVLGDSSLWIENLSLSDSGTYYCNAVTVVYLTVYPAPPAAERSPTASPDVSCCSSVSSSETDSGEEEERPDLEDFLKDSAKETPPTQRPPTPTKYWIALVVMGGVVLLLALGSLSIKKFYPMEKEGCEMLYDDVYTSIEYVSFSKEQAGLFNQSKPEGEGVSLVCANEGKVLWSKGYDGGRSDILTAEGGVITQKLRADPGNRYRVLADLSLAIVNLSLSDSGTYYCNSVPVVDLTVYPAPAA
ncbi:hypothetical protein NFI96_015849, partial [Prochilodus magdalenae]